MKYFVGEKLGKMVSKGKKGRILSFLGIFHHFFVYDVTKGLTDENWVIRFSSNFYTILLIWTAHWGKNQAYSFFINTS